MNRVAILVLADAETHGDLGRVVNALMTAREFKEAGEKAKVGLLEEYHDHPSIRRLVDSGHQVITFGW